MLSAIRMMKLPLFVLFFGATAYALAEEEFADSSARIAYKLYDECTNDVGFSVCLKKKAITVLDRLGRMENVSLGIGINVVSKPDANCNETAVTEKELEQQLPRALDAKEDALSYMLMDKLFKYIGSRNVEISLPKFDAQELVEEARKGDFGDSGGHGGGGGGGGGGGKKRGGKKGGKKGGGMMNTLMMVIGAKMAALMGLKTIGAFLIATKALIIGKIALLLSGMMLLRKIMGGKNGGGASPVVHSSGWDSSSSHGSSIGGGSFGGGGFGGGGYGGGGNGGWQSGGWSSGGGGYDRRSYDAQDLAYKSYSNNQE